MAAPQSDPKSATTPVAQAPATPNDDAPKASPGERPREIGGPKGLEPTRYGDWERNGRVSDF